MVGISTRISIVNCGDIPRSQGKAERVIDTRIAIQIIKAYWSELL